MSDMNLAKKVVKRDEIGVLSERNSVSKYWGVAKPKNKLIDGFAVRFYDSESKTTIHFKPMVALSETVAATIATRFHDQRELYNVTTSFVVEADGAKYLINNVENTISGAEEAVQPELKEGFHHGATVKNSGYKKARKPRTPKDPLRDLIDSIKLNALKAGKAVVKARNSVFA